MVKEYKVVLEIEIGAESPVEAAEKVQEWIQDKDSAWAFYVQSYSDDTVYSIDLAEDIDYQIQEDINYIPLIT